MRGRGPYWESIRSLFEISKKRHGFGGSDRPEALPPESVAGPRATDPQLSFGFLG